MLVALERFDLRILDCRSLKQKRHVVKSLSGDIRSRFEVSVGENGLKASAWGEPIDPARHVLSHEVKAITYHGLRVEREGDGWIAEVIVDI